MRMPLAAPGPLDKLSGMTAPVQIVAVDIGGTHARFALATLGSNRPTIADVHVYKTAEFADLPTAWARFATDIGVSLPRNAAVAVAGPANEPIIRFTNNPWVIKPATLAGELGIDQAIILNDFGAVAHAVAWAEDNELTHLAGPKSVPATGVTTIAGLGTGLGVAQLVRRPSDYLAIETEGAHGDFASVDALEDRILERLRARYVRVSDERVASGPGLANIYEALGAIGGHSIAPRSDADLWQAAIDVSDALAASALDRLVLSFGSILGDLALQHGANRVVVTGGLANRVADRLTAPAFHARFCAKGRFAERMRAIPIQLSTIAEPGLLGAAAAFAQHRGG